MMTFYAAAGSYQIRSEDGKNMPYIMRLGKLQPVSIPEFSLWSMLLWDVLTYEELHKKFYDKMEETEIEPSSFDKSLEMLVTLQLSQSCMVTRMPAMIISIISASLAMMLSWKLSGVSGRESCSWAATQLAKHPTSRSCLTTMLRVLEHPKKTEAKVSQIMSVP